MEEVKLSPADAALMAARPESHFWDFKSKRIEPKKLQQTVVAMLNADGGEIAVGIENPQGKPADPLSLWDGFSIPEDTNAHVQSVVQDITPPPPVEFSYQYIAGQEAKGLVLLVRVLKSENVHKTSAGVYKLRKGPQSLTISDLEVQNLRLSKGLISFEDQLVAGMTPEELRGEHELTEFLADYSPRTIPDDFLRKERLVRADGETKRPTYAGVLLFAESPQAVLPKKCAIKITRYTTSDAEPSREHLHSQTTIDGPLYGQITRAVQEITRIVESVAVLGAAGLEKPKYPADAIQEILVNAVIHRDYNLSDDIQVFIFDNRIEIKSPGRLPGHITPQNIMTERFARNPKIVRLLHRYKNPPNKDIGEGLRTAFQKMQEMRLKDPQIAVAEHSVTVTLPHEPLAAPETIVLEYLQHHPTIDNKTGRQLTGIKSENAMKDVFYRLRDRGLIRLKPAGGASSWRPTTKAEQEEHAKKGIVKKRRRPRAIKKAPKKKAKK